MADKFTQLLPLLGALVAFLLAALLLVYIFRLVFGKRIRAPGPRNRPRRLDVVDVFDLDKERQLVIVRRDNTEHLLLIGGPNDVLVEGAINRLDLTTTQSAPTTASANWPAAPSSADEKLEAEVRPSATGLKPAGPLNLPPDLFAQKSPALSSSTTAPIVSAPSSPLAEPPPPLSPTAPRPSLSLSTPPARPAPPPRPPGMPSFLSRTQRIITPKKETEEGVSAPAAAPEPFVRRRQFLRLLCLEAPRRPCRKRLRLLRLRHHPRRQQDQCRRPKARLCQPSRRAQKRLNLIR